MDNYIKIVTLGTSISDDFWTETEKKFHLNAHHIVILCIAHDCILVIIATNYFLFWQRFSILFKKECSYLKIIFLWKISKAISKQEHILV